MSNYYKDSTNTNVIPIIRIGEVTSVIDTTKSGRIQVRITGVDDTESDKSLIDCVPLLPKYLIALPKVGECVFVFQYEHNDSSPSASFKNKRFCVLFCNNPYKKAHDDTHPLTPVSNTLSHSFA